MKCKWYAAFEGICTNGMRPYRGDTCPTSEHPEVCKYAEYAEKQPEIPQLSAEELAKTLRLCGSASCCGCAFSKNFDCGNIIFPQAADMLEKLAAEKEAKKPEWISVKDRPPERKGDVYLCYIDSCLFPGSQYISIREFCDDGEWEAHGTVTHWMPLPEPPKKEER